MDIYEIGEYSSDYILSNVDKIYAFLTACVVLAGLIGNSIIILMFVKKKLRSNPSHVYLLCNAVNDNIILIIYFLEKFFNHFPKSDTLDFILETNFSCKFLGYLKNMLRFNSASIVIAFTIQRLYVVRWPLKTKFKIKKNAWKSVGFIWSTSCVLNLWAAFLIEWKKNKSCNISKEKNIIYFVLNIIYIFLVIVIPSIIICFSNALIIRTTNQKNSKRSELTQSINAQSRVANLTTGLDNLILMQTPKASSVGLLTEQTNKKIRLKPHYLTCKQLANNKLNIRRASAKMTKNLILVSFSFVILNFPYSIVWTVFYCCSFFDTLDINSFETLRNALELTEILFMFNYGVKFFILWFTGTLFRNMFENFKSIIIFIFIDLKNI
jgi:hypothetical protein